MEYEIDLKKNYNINTLSFKNEILLFNLEIKKICLINASNHFLHSFLAKYS